MSRSCRALKTTECFTLSYKQLITLSYKQLISSFKQGDYFCLLVCFFHAAFGTDRAWENDKSVDRTEMSKAVAGVPVKGRVAWTMAAMEGKRREILRRANWEDGIG